jgi:hypothetical protein
VSQLSDFLTLPGFWPGTIAGGVVASAGAALINMRSTRKSDERKFDQEDKTKEAEREERNRQQVREECLRFSDSVADALNAMVDRKGTFNVVRDMLEGQEKRAEDKLEFADAVMAEMQKVSVALTRLQMTAPTPILDKAVGCFQAIRSVAGTITQPFAYQPAYAAAGQAFSEFKNAFREYIKLDTYSEPEALRATEAYMETLKRHVDDYVEETRQSRQ